MARTNVPKETVPVQTTDEILSMPSVANIAKPYYIIPGNVFYGWFVSYDQTNLAWFLWRDDAIHFRDQLNGAFLLGQLEAWREAVGLVKAKRR